MTAAVAASLLCLAPATAGCTKEPPASGFVPRLGTPAAADRYGARLLEQRRLVQKAAEDLNAYVVLPYRVTVLARSCAGEGTGYDPATRTIELCYDDLAQDRDLFTRGHPLAPDAPPDASPGGAPEAPGAPSAGSAARTGDEVADQIADQVADQVAEVVRETLYHEAGHALAEVRHLRFDDDRAEEDAADRFARLMLLREGPEGEHALLTAARAYDLAAAADPAPDPTDEHAPDAVRAESHRCAVYGAAPARHPDLATPSRATCPTAWPPARDTWTHALDPLLRR
ncbi:hypothetical protein AMK16_10470 [Streptomyces sp. CB00455]|nr:hypothetical protein AMK16_10470 [Streptomyces sp. CB00455]